MTDPPPAPANEPGVRRAAPCQTWRGSSPPPSGPTSGNQPARYALDGTQDALSLAAAQHRDLPQVQAALAQPA